MKEKNTKPVTDYKPNILERGWDRILGVFYPARELRNIKLRQIVQRSYAGAKLTPSLKEHWEHGSGPNDDIRQDRQKVANRVRQLVRDMPWMDGAIDAATDYKIGEGFNFKPAVTDEQGKMIREVNMKIKDAFLFWCEKAGANNRDTFGDLQRLAVRQMIECGEVLYIHRIRNRKYSILTLEPDCIDSSMDGTNTDQGVEYDPETNEFNRYHLVNSLSNLEKADKQFAVNAENVIHLYRQLRPWQRRGISPLVQTILIAGDLDEFLSGEMSAQQMASRWLAFITDPNADSVNAEISTVLENLTIETLPAGKAIQLAPGAERPTLGLETFQKIFLRVLSVILRVPYSAIASDYQQLNYNTLREIRNNTIHRLKPEWAYLTNHFHNPIYRRWMDYAVLSGDLDLPGYFTPGGQRRYQRCFWMPPGIESVDVLRDIKGVVTAADRGMYDPQDWIMSQGEDPEEVLSGIKEFQDLVKQFGIELSGQKEDTNIQEKTSEDD